MARNIFIAGASGGLGFEITRYFIEKELLEGSEVIEGGNLNLLCHTRSGESHFTPTEEWVQFDILESPRKIKEKILSTDAYNLWKTTGGLTALIYCIGIPEVKTFSSYSSSVVERDFLKILKVNTVGFAKLLKIIISLGVVPTDMSVVVLSSVVAHNPVVGCPFYIASKACLEGLVRAIAEENAHLFRVNSIAVGYSDVGMIREVPPKKKEGIKYSIPMRRFAYPSEIASLVHYLTCEDSKYITGQTFHVNGGLVMK